MRYLPYILSIPLYIVLAGTSRSEFGITMLLFAALLGLFWWGGKRNNWELSAKALIIIAVLFRLTMFVDLPSLSDDYCRFVYDGELATQGISPYDNTPNDLIGEEVGPAGKQYWNLNSKDYHTVYLPIQQSIFAVSALYSDSTMGVVNAMRTIYLLVDILLILTLIHLVRLKAIKNYIPVLYGLFPIVVTEFVGNLHFELFMCFFLCLFFYLAARGMLNLSGVPFAMAIGAKMLPLMFLPFLVRWWRWKQQLVFGAIVVLALAVLLLPLYDFGRWANVMESIGLYFDTFEFNASIYYIVRAIGTEIVGYNPIETAGPAMNIIVALLILVAAMFRKVRSVADFAGMSAIALSIYFFFAPNVQPWYLVPVFLLGSMGGYLFPVVWLVLSMLSYHAYRFSGYHEVEWLLLVEYLPVYGMFVYEVILKRRILGKNESDKQTVVV